MTSKSSDFDSSQKSKISEALKIRCGKNLRTDFAIYSRVGDFANLYDLISQIPYLFKEEQVLKVYVLIILYFL